MADFDDMVARIEEQLPYMKAIIAHIKIIERTDDQELIIMSFEAIEQAHYHLHGTNDAMSRIKEGWGDYSRISDKYKEMING